MPTPISPRSTAPDPKTVPLQIPSSTAPRPSPTTELDLSETSRPPRPGYPLVWGYEILSVVGCGGMAVVYEARHRELNRRVAIKTLRGEALTTPGFRERFRAEAEAIARLQHPNVIQVFEVGTVEPQPGEGHPSPFLALEFVDGGSLTQHTRTPQSPRFAAVVVGTLARAAHAAHRLGIVHRDLKPSNVLLTRDGQPKIADFGIAKQLDPARSSSGPLTSAGTVVGTPEYMAPEQLEGQPASPAFDIYALGVILYEMLTGRVPFQGASFADTLMLTLHQEPVPPSRLQPNVPRDLETICLKCLEKAPAKRYESAQTLADDLAAWAEGRTIRARAMGPVERTLRWAWRNPAVASLSLAVLLVAVGGIAGVLWQWRDAQRNADDARSNAALAELAASEAREATKKERWERYRVSVLAASGALRLHDADAARRALEGAPEEYRDWVWRLQYAQLDRAQTVLRGRGTPSAQAHFTRDGRWADLLGNDSSIRVWDTAAQKEFALVGGDSQPRLSVLSGDGSTLAYATRDHAVVLCEVPTGRTRAVLRGHADTINHVCFTAGGARVISTADDRTVRVWDAGSGRQLHQFEAHVDKARALRSTPDGRFVVGLAGEELNPRLWDLATGRELAKFEGLQAPPVVLKFNPRGDRFAAVEVFPSNVVRVWEVPSGKPIATLRGHENQVWHVEFSPDGTRLATCSMDRTVRLWDVTAAPAPREGPPLYVLRGHMGWVQHAAFSPDGTRLVSAAHDRTLRYWDTRSGQQLAVLHGHAAEIRGVAFWADGTTIASASADGTVRLWSARDVERNYALRGHEKFVYGVAFHPDGQRVASAAWDGTARVWDATSGKQLLNLDHGKGTIVTSVAYQPGGRLLATLARDDRLRLWEAQSGRQLHAWNVPSDNWRGSRLAFSPQGDIVACGSYDGKVRMWDVNTKEEVAVLGQHLDGVRDVAFSPGGHSLASAGEAGDRTVRIWDLGSKAEAQVLRGHTAAVYALAWNPRGKLLASGSLDGSVRLWDTATWREAGCLQHGVNVYGLAFSPDGKLLAAACADNLIRVWDVESRQEVAELSGHDEYVHSLAFSPDGTRLVSGSGDHTLRVWDALSPAERGRR